MFEFLSSLGEAITARYQTVIRDIKSKTNSFYDAYLDLQEASIKAILDENGIDYEESRTCGYLLRGEEVTKLFRDKLGVPTDTYEQIRSHTSKINHHKHRKEKCIGVDSVVAFMESYHRFMRICCSSDEEFDPAYFEGIFGEFERTNAALNREKDSLVSELEELVKEKRLSDEQLRAFQEALANSKISEEGLAEQNDALLREISALKSLKLAILDQKLNRTIDMLNDLQEYVTESRAVSLAVGYTIVGKEHIGSYIDLARSEMGKPAVQPAPELTAASAKPDNASKGIPKMKRGDDEEEMPYNVMDATTRPPESDTLRKRIGEDPEPYLHSKDVTVRPDEKDLTSKRLGLTIRSLALAFGVAALVISLLLNGWLKLVSIAVFLPLVFLVLEMICYVKNLNEIPNESKWILRQAEIDVDDKNHTISVIFAFRGGRWVRFLASSIFVSAMAVEAFGLLYLAAMQFVFQSTEPGAWATLASAIMTAVALVLVLVQLVLFSKRPRPYSGKYVCFNTEKGTLVNEVKKFGLDAWELEKND